MTTVNSRKANEARDLYAFSDLQDQAKFTKIISELRCSVCQNQALGDSMAPLAVDLREQIYQKVQSKESEQQIIEFVSSRYGEFVLYRPPVQWDTAVLWFGPLMMLLLGFVILRSVFKGSQ